MKSMKNLNLRFQRIFFFGIFFVLFFLFKKRLQFFLVFSNLFFGFLDIILSLTQVFFLFSLLLFFYFLLVITKMLKMTLLTLGNLLGHNLEPVQLCIACAAALIFSMFFCCYYYSSICNIFWRLLHEFLIMQAFSNIFFS